ncbi:hypothetical protein AOLI_G00120490 [Acnodon oligacanthus]
MAGGRQRRWTLQPELTCRNTWCRTTRGTRWCVYEAEQNILLTLVYLDCCLNPVLYAFIGVKFRNHFCQIMEDLWCLRKRYFASARSSQQTSELYAPAHQSDESNHESSSSFKI